MPAGDQTYRTVVGLELNRDRVEVRKIVNDALAYSIATGEMEIPDEWFPLLCDSPEEADALRRSRTMESLKLQAKAKMY